jgi:amino acid adenylation domain-containing protein
MSATVSTKTNYNLAIPFYENSVKNPESLALYVGGKRYSYAELGDLARRISGWLCQKTGDVSGTVGIIASRTAEAYAGVLGTLWSGKAYVPINPHTPEDRLIRILQQTKLDALIADRAGLDLLSDHVLESAPRRILFGPGAGPSRRVLEFQGTSSESFDQLPDEGPKRPVFVAEDELAYIIFTSGTTGAPKGVMISSGNVAQFLAAMRLRFQPVSTDRISQTSELTFDVSVFEMFIAWNNGASVEVIPANQLMAPARFIADRQLTVWSSVPSIAAFMRRMRMLKPGAFPSIRYSVFAGEALPYPLAEAWQMAAPSSVVENLYGPTEATIYCIGATVGPNSPPTPGRDTVPSGLPLPGLDAAILDESLNFLSAGMEGQLAVSGGQIAQGYFNDSELTRQRFPSINGKTWYLTGDLARKDERGIFHHLGRIDNQVKILGNRVEIEEVEAHLREIIGTDLVAAVAWPITDGSATGIVAFHCSPGVSREAVRDGMKKRVPDYMIPKRVHLLDTLPLGSSGKIDRKALTRMLDDDLV